ncbi:MAG: leucyl/phenylalanyl-tRNA--protein transferase [Phycisphaeraceae bacterium]|nr:leucyl/phenylalanyl-tRNA--protein transferase [Phycisphaerae bacterium]MBX3392674.1 leucyl/phenylalanyl-tRNA--protein transferase [Phycisphaeraceae bacterium]
MPGRPQASQPDRDQVPPLPGEAGPAFVDGILAMYRRGWFPMADPITGSIDWFRPRWRGVIPIEPGAFRVSRSLRQRVRSGRLEIRSDTAFRRVITECSKPRRSEPLSWIDDRIIEAYCVLHDAGRAHSVEAWLGSSEGGRTLVGGLYGVHLGGVFFGESMFCRPESGGTDASKVCLVYLVHHMRRRGMTLLDAQVWSEHLGRMGCRKVPQSAFVRLLDRAVGIDAAWEPFDAGSTNLEFSRDARA